MTVDDSVCRCHGVPWQKAGKTGRRCAVKARERGREWRERNRKAKPPPPPKPKPEPKPKRPTGFKMVKLTDDQRAERERQVVTIACARCGWSEDGRLKQTRAHFAGHECKVG